MPDKTAVIYCRVSTTRQADDELPIQSQRQRCEDKAKQLDAVVLKIYSDEGLSGQSGDRPALSASDSLLRNAPTDLLHYVVNLTLCS